MPYDMSIIPKYRKGIYDKEIERLVDILLPSGYAETDTAYIIYQLLKEVFGRDGFRLTHTTKALRILERVNQEYRRKIIAPYKGDKTSRCVRK